MRVRIEIADTIETSHENMCAYQMYRQPRGLRYSGVVAVALQREWRDPVDEKHASTFPSGHET